MGCMMLAQAATPAWLTNLGLFVLVLVAFGVIIFVHELGHFLFAKWAGIRVLRFAVGFGPRVVGWRRGEGLTFGRRPEYTPEQLEALGYGETDYCINAFPLGGYVKMLGQDDIVIDEQTGDVQLSRDPRSFTNKPVGKRMLVVSGGVIFNLLFAAIATTAVFMIGRQMIAPVVGLVQIDSPAAGKLLPGDRILEINGTEVLSFEDVALLTALADDRPVRLTIERTQDGSARRMEVTLRPVRVGPDQLPMLGIGPPITTRAATDGRPVGDRPGLKAGDRVVAVEDEPITDGWQILRIFAEKGYRPLKLTVERPDDPADPHSRTKRLEVYQRAALYVEPASLGDDTNVIDAAHILGLRRRLAIAGVRRGSPAAEAGLQAGDVIVRWGSVPNPTYAELVEAIHGANGRPTPVVVRRGGRLIETEVTPRPPVSLLGTKPPQAGIEFGQVGEEDQPIVADTAPGTPAAALRIPRGSRIVRIDGQPVRDWFDVVEVLRTAAGRRVPIEFASGEDRFSRVLDVPACLSSELKLPRSAQILSIDGQQEARVTQPDGSEQVLSLPNSLAVRALLAARVGKTVPVEYTTLMSTQRMRADFTVRKDNTDPWLLRIRYVYSSAALAPQRQLVRTNNPLMAMRLAGRLMRMQLYQIYRLLGNMTRQPATVRHVSGPVGIVAVAMEQARSGLSDLLFFMAFLSVNLAVLNFLPIPILDGGLMLFLIIEKIKGSPLSFKAQMISSLVSLAAIILFALFVTIQDISKLLG